LARPSNVIEVAAESGQGDHSAPFPRLLVQFFLKAFSDAGDTVFDPFLGSGTTIAAAHVLGRNGYGSEISPSYCDLVVLRWQKLSGGAARLAGDGRTFDEIAAEQRRWEHDL
jgi:DNA modification methylase